MKFEIKKKPVYVLTLLYEEAIELANLLHDYEKFHPAFTHYPFVQRLVEDLKKHNL